MADEEVKMIILDEIQEAAGFVDFYERININKAVYHVSNNPCCSVEYWLQTRYTILHSY
jgi:hypothetical protein